MTELLGWLLDVYADPQGKLALWLLGEDGGRHHLRQDFPVTFYASGPTTRLRQLWKYLQEQESELTLQRTERRDLFQEQPLTVLAVQMRQPAEQPRRQIALGDPRRQRLAAGEVLGDARGQRFAAAQVVLGRQQAGVADADAGADVTVVAGDGDPGLAGDARFLRGRAGTQCQRTGEEREDEAGMTHGADLLSAAWI